MSIINPDKMGSEYFLEAKLLVIRCLTSYRFKRLLIKLLLYKLVKNFTTALKNSLIVPFYLKLNLNKLLFTKKCY